MTVRDFTDAEEAILRDNGRCPFCGAEDQWLEGPHGGMSVNLQCANCRTKINFMGPFTPQLLELGPSVIAYTPVVAYDEGKPTPKESPKAKQRRWWHRLSVRG